MFQNVGEPKKVSFKTVNAGPYKFKDKQGRDAILFDLEKVFGFLPRRLIISKVLGMNNTIMVGAIKESQLDTDKVIASKPTIFVPEHIMRKR